MPGLPRSNAPRNGEENSVSVAIQKTGNFIYEDIAIFIHPLDLLKKNSMLSFVRKVRITLPP